MTTSKAAAGSAAEGKAAAVEQPPNEPGKPRRVIVPETENPHAPAAPQTVAERRAAQAKEYGQYVAVAMIREPVTGANIFAPGDPVPVSHVERFPELFILGENIEKTEG